jgi:NADH-quinone oxidoreductase subunit N
MLLQANTSTLFPVDDLQLIAPELLLTIAACIVLVLEVVLPRAKKRWSAYFSLAALGGSLISLGVLASNAGASWKFWNVESIATTQGFYGMVRFDGFALFFHLVFILAAALTVLISIRYLDVEESQFGEFYALVLFATVGMMFLSSAFDLISLFVSLELMAICFYVLVAFTRRERRSNEAAIKYFLLGAFSSGILLYGFSLLYGMAGSTNLGEIAVAVKAIVASLPAEGAQSAASLRPLLLLSIVTLAAGLFFKVSVVPFHMWTPDAYEGAPTPVTAFLSTASKAAGFVILVRIFLAGLVDLRADWAPLVGVAAALTILVGNLGAITQTNAKRLLAYSSIANAGYLLLGLLAANEYGYIGIAIYLLVYTLMNMGAFGVIISVQRKGLGGENVEDLRGMAQRAPALAFMMAIFMLSLGGLPATGGFIGKWYLFGGLIARAKTEGKPWYTWLAVWAVVNTVVSFFYYIRFIRTMYISEEAGEPRPLVVSLGLQAALIAAVVGVVLLGVYPQPVIKLATALMK